MHGCAWLQEQESGLGTHAGDLRPLVFPLLAGYLLDYLFDLYYCPGCGANHNKDKDKKKHVTHDTNKLKGDKGDYRSD